MELRHLRYFVVVAEELSITRAARRLRMAQPPLSQQLARLERELGVTLLERLPRGVRLTEAGHTLLAEATALLARADEVATVTRSVAAGQRGVLRIGCVPSGFLDFLPSVLPAFRERAPTVHTMVYEMSTAAQCEQIRLGQLDIGVVRNPPPAGGDDPLRHRRVRVEPLTVVLPDGHRLARQPTVALAELAEEPFVTFPRRIAAEHFDAITSHCVRAGFSPRVAAEVDHDDALLGLVAAGVGVALVPEATTRLRLPGVTPCPLLDPPMTSLSLAWSADSTCGSTRTFLDLAPAVPPNGGGPTLGPPPEQDRAR
jgi:LysR family transcriptional regulator, benzoate and cis,cis-muconate-responsive activator of ben and cat genes